jgi:predicted TPR repeat methyltransferase
MLTPSEPKPSSSSQKSWREQSWRERIHDMTDGWGIPELMDFGQEIFYRFQHLADANFEIGKRMADSGRFTDAILRLKLCLWLRANHTQAHAMLAHCYIAQEKPNKALPHLQQAINLNPQDERSVYMLATLDASLVPAALMPRSMPYSLMVEYFNSIAEQYEFMQQAQQYRAHLYADQAVWDELDRRRHDYAVLALGSGTGLCGQLLAEYAEDLVGVDFSHKMMDIARMKRRPDGRRIYQSLVYQDVRNYFLQSPPEAYFDAVVACHVLNYIGNIHPVFDGIAKVLKPQGVAVLQVEAYDQTHDFGLLKGKGRFGHGDGYMRSQFERVGLVLIGYHAVQVYPDYEMAQYVVRKV